MEDFNIHDFLFDTVVGLISYRPDYAIKEMTAGWYSKGVFTTDDVEKIDELIKAQYPVEPVLEENFVDPSLSENEEEKILGTETV